MSQIPIIIPLIVAGAFLGNAWPNKSLAGVWKKGILASALAGVLNGGYTWLVSFLNVAGANSSANNTVAFIISSVLAGFMTVLVIYLSAIVTIRYRRGKTIESEE